MQNAQIIYGTAWKEDTTSALVNQAITSGFRAIDTANQPKHYQEARVGEALRTLAKQGIRREDLFLQTKFTPVDGQDQRIPYDPRADLTTQVRQSFLSSLTHLHTDYLDSYLLHGPYNHPGLGENDWEVWGAIEEIYRSRKVKQIGISNVNIKQLELLWTGSLIKPMIVQNRCYAIRGWDKDVREFCKAHNIIYQGFSLLTANPQVWQNQATQEIATRHKKTPMQIIFRFAIQIGITPLTGTTSAQHMKEDLDIFDFELAEGEMGMIEGI